MAPESLAYEGSELELFQAAHNWKRYWASEVASFVGNKVIEVGSGLGANIPFLYRDQETWICIEPDPSLADQLRAKIAKGELPAVCEVVNGMLKTIPASWTADTLIYADVLEHIENDHLEIARAVVHLEEGGHLIVLSPAYPWLFSPFDATIGHWRRYTRRSYEGLTQQGLELVSIKYMDSLGIFASAMNRFILKARHPSEAQINLWDSAIVPASRRLDALTGYRFGRSILGIWRRCKDRSVATIP